MPDKISVLLVDDHSLVRRGFRRILEDEPDIEVTGEAADGAEAVRLASELKPNVVVTSVPFHLGRQALVPVAVGEHPAVSPAAMEG